MEFKVGDRIRIIRPKTKDERGECPGWVVEMNQYEGIVTTISNISNPQGFRVKGASSYAFNPKWLKPVPTINLYL